MKKWGRKKARIKPETWLKKSRRILGQKQGKQTTPLRAPKDPLWEGCCYKNKSCQGE